LNDFKNYKSKKTKLINISMDHLQKELYSYIQKDERLLDFFLNSTADSFSFLDIENPQNEWFQPKFWVNFGYSVSLMSSRPLTWEKLLTDKSLSQWNKTLADCILSPELCRVETLNIKHYKGHLVKTQCEIKTLLDENNNPKYLLKSYQLDTSAQVQNLATDDFEKYLREFFLLGYDLLSIINNEGNLIKLNPAWENVLGYTISELTGPKFLEIIHPDDLQKAIDLYEKLLLEKSFSKFTSRYKAKDGLYRYIEWHSVYKDNKIYSLSRDVTAQVEAKKRIEENEEILRNLNDNLPGLILRYQIDTEGKDKLLYINEGVKSIFELDIEESLADISKIWAKVHPDDLPGMQKSIAESSQSLSFWKATWRINLNNGVTKWILGQGMPQRQEDGSIIWNSLLLDITTQKELEIELQNQYNLFKGVQESYRDPVFSLDTQYRYTSFNEAHRITMKMIYGSDIQINRYALEYIKNNEDKERALKNLTRALAGEHIIEESIFGDISEEKRYFEIYHSPTKNEEGDITGVAFLAKDITLRTLAEQKRQTTNQRLELLEKFIDHSHDAIQVSDEEGQLVYINRIASLRLGIRMEDVHQYNVSDFEILFTDKSKWSDHIQELKEKGKLVITSKNINQHNRKLINVEVTVAYQEIHQKGYVIAISRDITERIKSEKDFKGLQDRLQVIINNFPDGSISLISKNLKLLLTGGKGYERHSISTESLIGTHIQDVLAPEVSQKIADSLPTLKQGTSENFEIDFEGNTYLNTLQGVFDENGEMSAFVLVSINITERKRSENLLIGLNKELRAIEEELRASEEELITNLEELTSSKEILEEQKLQLLLIFDATNLGTWDWNMLTGETFYNNKWAEMLGYSLEEIESDASIFFNLLHPDESEWVINLINKQRDGTNTDFRIEFRMRTKSGDWKWILDTGKVVAKTADGRGLRAIGTHQDITERKKSELALQESKEEAILIARQYQSILDSQAVYVVKIDLQGNYSYINNCFSEIFDKKENSVGKKAFVRTIPEDEEKCVAAKNLCFEYPEISHEVVLRKTTKEGIIKGAKWEFKGVFGEDTIVKEILCVGFDITEQLETLARTEQLLDISSTQNTKLKSFTYIVSHNIRSHAANFIGLISLLKDTRNSDEKELYLSMLESTASQLDETIHNLNDIITINENFSKPRCKQNLKKEIDKTLDILAGEIIKHKVQVSILVSDDIYLDTIPAYLESILLNIISNAIKYHNPDKKPIIEIKAQKEDDFICLFVKDNGLGIDLHRYREKLFGMYKTFHNNENARGFGLYITKSQVETLGGKIEVESQPNKGSNFKIYFYAPD
jgi:PAS domain S-box-containing protein